MLENELSVLKQTQTALFLLRQGLIFSYDKMSIAVTLHKLRNVNAY